MFGRLRAALGAEEKGLRGTVKDALAGRLPGKAAPEAPPAKPGPPEAAAGRVERSAAGAARAEGAVVSAPRPSPEAPAVAERLGGEAEPSAALVGSVDVAPEAAIAPLIPEEPVVAGLEVAPVAEIVAPVAAAVEPAVAAPPVVPESPPAVAPATVAPTPPAPKPAAAPAPPAPPEPPPAPVKLSLAAAAAAAARAPEKLLHADQGSTDLDHYIARAKANNRDVGAIRGGIGINRADDGTPYWGPVDNESSRAKAAGHLLAIDQWECISCGTCVEQTDKVFVLPADGKAAPVAQDGPMDLIQDAIEACPVTCIHWVSEGEATERGLATSFQDG